MDAVQIAEEMNEQGMVEGRVFEDKEIRGPAMVTPVEEVTVKDCTWGAPFDQMFHSTEKTRLVGVIGLRNVTFLRCVFRDIGFLARPNFIEAVGKDALRDRDSGDDSA